MGNGPLTFWDKVKNFWRSMCPVRFSPYANESAIERNNQQRVKVLKEAEDRMIMEREALEIRTRIYVTHQENLTTERANLDEYNNHLKERTAWLDKMQKDLDAQKEFMLGQDNMKTKQDILLPAMKLKWEAEAKKLDAERVHMLATSPEVGASIVSRLKELNTRIKMIKEKPRTMGNDNLLLEAEARMKELAEVTAIIDLARAKNESPKTVPVPA